MTNCVLSPQLEAQLTEQPGRVVGSMLEAEFAEAMEKAVPESSDLLSRRLFLQSLVLLQEKSDSGRQSLPVRNLACILKVPARGHGHSACMFFIP